MITYSVIVDGDLAAGVLAEQDPVTCLHVEGDSLALVAHLAVADGDDLALLGLFLRGVRDDDASAADVLGLDTCDENAIVERADLHGLLFPGGVVGGTSTRRDYYDSQTSRDQGSLLWDLGLMAGRRRIGDAEGGRPCVNW